MATHVANPKHSLLAFCSWVSMNELHCTLALLVHTCGHIGPWLLGIGAHPVPSLSAMDLQTFETWLFAGGTTFQVASAPDATIWPFAFGSGSGLAIWLLLFVGTLGLVSLGNLGSLDSCRSFHLLGLLLF